MRNGVRTLYDHLLAKAEPRRVSPAFNSLGDPDIINTAKLRLWQRKPLADSISILPLKWQNRTSCIAINVVSWSTNGAKFCIGILCGLQNSKSHFGLHKAAYRLIGSDENFTGNYVVWWFLPLYVMEFKSGLAHRRKNVRFSLLNRLFCLAF